MSNIERRGGTRRTAPAEWFDGHVEMEAILEDSAHGVRQNRVHFHDGGRTHWHLHTGSQVLYFVAGQGMVQEDGGQEQPCEAGDIVHVHPGAKHRHGAREGGSATHIAITLGESIWDNDARYPH
ncbi:MAG: cupin domain-containing protein [Acidimicrobiales bacterium]